jgi:hypothetical protein
MSDTPKALCWRDEHDAEFPTEIALEPQDGASDAAEAYAQRLLDGDPEWADDKHWPLTVYVRIGNEMTKVVEVHAEYSINFSGYVI